MSKLYLMAGFMLVINSGIVISKSTSTDTLHLEDIMAILGLLIGLFTFICSLDE